MSTFHPDGFTNGDPTISGISYILTLPPTMTYGLLSIGFTVNG